MRSIPVILAILLLAGCATTPPPRSLVHVRAAAHPAARSTPAAKAAEAAAVSNSADRVPVTGGVTPAAAAAPEPGAAIPFMGFRPMRGQKPPGA